MNVDKIRERIDLDRFFKSREKLVEGVFNALRFLIINQILKGGERLDYRELGSLLDVSRVPIREAVQRLEATGLLEVRNKLGTFVVKLSHKDIEDICNLRTILEIESLESGIERIPIEELKKIKQIFSEETGIMEKDPEYHTSEAIINADDKFHNLIVESAESRIFSRVYQQIENYIPMLRKMNRREYVSSKEHINIIDAILEKDKEKAKKLLESHLSGVFEILLIDE